MGTHHCCVTMQRNIALICIAANFSEIFQVEGHRVLITLGGFCRDAPAGWSTPMGWALQEPIAHQLCAMEPPVLHPQLRCVNCDLLLLHLILSIECL